MRAPDPSVRSHARSALRAAIVVFTAALALPAQADPKKEIEELARRVAEQMQEIDRLLLESGRKAQARERPKQLLEQARDVGRDVEQSIDDLIAKLTEMKDQGGGSSQDQQDQQQQQPQDQDQQQQQGRQNRRENQTPDIVQQPPRGEQQQPQSGEQQQPQPQELPEGGHETPEFGENRTGRALREGETAPGQPGSGDGSWGELQSYVNFLKNRGSAPKVPEKYRKYHEAYLKSKQRGSGGK